MDNKMENYKSLKSASKVSVKKDGSVLQTVQKQYDPNTGEESLKTKTIKISDVDAMIAVCKDNITREESRQANFEQLKKRLRSSLINEKVYNNIMKYGNTTAASIPIALTEARNSGKIKNGDTIVLAAFGSGFLHFSQSQ